MKHLIRVPLLFLAPASILILSACMGSNTTTAAACPQLRDTEFAPAYIAAKQNPLPATSANIRAGENLFQSAAQPVACAQCHGRRGDGNGPMAKMFNPAPRNFNCTATMAVIPDGQLYWIIKNGSLGSSMPAFNALSDEHIWQLIMYLRSFSAKLP